MARATAIAAASPATELIATDGCGRSFPASAASTSSRTAARPSIYLQSMADATNDGYFGPEQIWDRSNVSCFVLGRATGSASPLNWTEGQYLRLSQSIDAGYNLDTPSVVKAKYRGAGPILGTAASASTTPVAARTMAPRSRSGLATLPARRTGHGTAVTGRCVFWTNVSTPRAGAPPTGRRSSSGIAMARVLSNGAGDNRAA